MARRGKQPPEGERTFARALKWMREEQELTQWELAEQIGVTQPTLSRWESGDAEPQISALPRISRALRSPVLTLLRMVGIDPEEDLSPAEWAEREAERRYQEQRRRREEHLRELDRLRGEPRQDFKEMSLSVR